MVQQESLAIRSDLMDCYIDICSPEVLLKFAENFDYGDIRQDFLHNEVQNYEFGDNCLHILTKGTHLLATLLRT